MCYKLLHSYQEYRKLVLPRFIIAKMTIISKSGGGTGFRTKFIECVNLIFAMCYVVNFFKAQDVSLCENWLCIAFILCKVIVIPVVACCFSVECSHKVMLNYPGLPPLLVV